MCLIFVNGPIRPSTKLFGVLAYLIQFLPCSVIPVAITGEQEGRCLLRRICSCPLLVPVYP